MSIRSTLVVLGVSLLVMSTAAAQPLITSSRVPQPVRLAATCLAFNADAVRYISGTQLSMHDYAEAASYWARRFESAEPSDSMRRRLLESAREKMDADFGVQPDTSGRASGTSTETYNGSYATVITMCQSSRAQETAE